MNIEHAPYLDGSGIASKNLSLAALNITIALSRLRFDTKQKTIALTLQKQLKDESSAMSMTYMLFY